MQIHRPTDLIFPPTGQQPHARASQHATDVQPKVRPVQPEVPVPQQAQMPSVVLTLSDPLAESEVVGSAATPVYGRGRVGVAGEAKINVDELSLQRQVELGKNKGVFTKITLSKDGVLLATPDPAHRPSSPEFVSAAVNTMRDFQEGLALLKDAQHASEDKQSSFLAGGLRSLQNAAAKFSRFA